MSGEVEGGAAAYRPASEMRLRSPRAPVVQISRKVAIIGVGVLAVAIGGAVFMSLRPQSRGGKTELYNTTSKATPDGLANLPKDYGASGKAIPKLGPPLPGDLGGPILRAGAPIPPMGEAGASQSTELQRIKDENTAAIGSHLFAMTPPGEASQTPGAGLPSGQSAAPALPTSGVVPGGGDHKLAFLNAPTERRTTSSELLQAPASPYVVQAGTTIAAALVTGLRSDIPGEVIAQVTQSVYDSPTGKILLIPQGSRLIGQYDAQVAFGQSRALVVWTRLILPTGGSLTLERQPAADAEGFAGLQDTVDNHWGALVKAAALSTLLSVGSEAGTGGAENNLAQAIRQGASQSFSQVGQQVVGRSLAVQPTLTIRAGFPVRVMVTRDLVLQPSQIGGK